MNPFTMNNAQELYPVTPEAVWAKANNIELLICDVDGVFSDGRIYLGNHGEELKAFHTRDGYGVKALGSQNIQVAIITGRRSQIVATRMQNLGVRHIYQGCENKLEAFSLICEELCIKPQNIAYIGDDLVDLSVMQQCGLSVTVQDGHPILKQSADLITQARGGFGAVRELCDIILIAQNKLNQAVGLSL